MVQVLDEVPSFGAGFARALGGGFSKGVSQHQDFLNELKLEKAKRGIQSELANQTIPQEFRKSSSPDQLSGQNINNQSSISNPSSQSNINRVLSDQDIFTKAARITEENNAAGLPTDYNSQVQLLEANRDKTRAAQSLAGDWGRQSLNQYYDKDSPPSSEMQEYMANKTQDLWSQGKTETEIRKEAGRLAKDLKNQEGNIEKVLKPRSYFGKISDKMKGTPHTSEKLIKAGKAAVKPFVEKGLIEEARTILSDPKKGYFPEQIEHMLGDLDSGSKQQVNLIPEALSKKFTGRGSFIQNLANLGNVPKDASEQDQKMLSDVLTKIYTKNPNSNLILLREDLMNKGYQWNDIRDVWNNLINSNAINPDQDQKNRAADTIQEPPENNLEELFNRTIGRSPKEK